MAPRPKTILAFLAVLVATLATLAPAARAAPAWVAPQTLGDAPGPATAVAVGPDGRSTLIWGGGYREPLSVAEAAPGGRFEPAGTIPVGAFTGRIEPVALAITPSGEQVAIIKRLLFDTDIVTYAASIRAPGGSFPEPVPFSPQLRCGLVGCTADLAVNPDGRAAFVWEFGGVTDVYGTIREPGGSFAPAERLSPIAQDAQDPAVALAPDGSGLVAWGGSENVNVAEILPNAAFEESQQIFAGAKRWIDGVDVAALPDGSVVGIVRRNATNTHVGVVTVFERPAGGSVTGGIHFDGDGAAPPQVAADGEGRLVIAWDGGELGARTIRVASRTARDEYSEPAVVARGKSGLADLTLRLVDGGPALAWLHRVSSDLVTAEAAVPSPAGFVTQTISDPTWGPSELRFAASAGGVMAASWGARRRYPFHLAGPGEIAQASTRDGVPAAP